MQKIYGDPQTRKKYLLLLSCVVLLLLAGCGKVKYSPAWYLFTPISPGGRKNIVLMLSGLKWTLLVTIAALIGTQIVGFIVALMRLTKNKLFNGIAAIYLELFRNIPLFALLFAVYYVSPILLGLSLSAFQALVLSIVLNESAFVCEIYRAGIESISHGHIEAARSLGMSSWQTMKRIVFPQAARRMLPALANNAIVLTKDTALGAGLAVGVLDQKALFLDTLNYRPFEIYTFLLLEYLFLLLLLSQCVRWIEKKTVIA
ncbi:MAG: amino acid ABC transporter permease [Nitrospinota bacterium]|nr:MAG: amino acid ABC transporter permease [Nitrospinota bacterium]